MAIHIQNKETAKIVANQKIISVVMKAGRIVWQAIRSCFGSGMWIPTKPWLYNEGWKEGRN